MLVETNKLIFLDCEVELTNDFLDENNQGLMRIHDNEGDRKESGYDTRNGCGETHYSPRVTTGLASNG